MPVKRASALVDNALSSAGEPLDRRTRALMEPRLGFDLGRVRVHTGARAAASARAVSAQAYTVGQDLVFDHGRYQPDADDGKRLLAHELTHVVQQSRGPVSGRPSPDGLLLSAPDDPFEREAQQVASDVVFAAGDYSPDTHTGQRLLTHEPAHVIQQRGATTRDPAPESSEVVAARRGVVQRQDDQNQSLSTEELDRQYRAAVAGSDWRRAAELLNGFNRDDIRTRLAELTRDQIDNIHLGALDNPSVGPDSQVAQLTAPSAPAAGNAPSASAAANTAPASTTDAGAPQAPQADVTRIIAALQEPQENGVGNYPVACAILDGMWIVVMFQTLEELRKRGYLDLLRGDVCPNMPRVGIAVEAVSAKSSPPVTWQFAKAHPAFANLPEQEQQEVATYLVLPWPIPADALAGTDQGKLTEREIIVGVLVGAAVIGGIVFLAATPGGQAFAAAILISLAPIGGETALVAGAPVAAEVVISSSVAEATAATALGGGSALVPAATTPLLVTTGAAAPTVAGTTATAVASSSWAAAATATIGTGIAATTLSSDNPQKPKDDDGTGCGSPKLPVTQIFWGSDKKGVSVIAYPLTICEGIDRGSAATYRFPAWDCIAAAGQVNSWGHTHLLHHELHGPGNEPKNLIITSKRLNTLVQEYETGRGAPPGLGALDMIMAGKTLRFETVVTGYWAESGQRSFIATGLAIAYQEVDPRTGGPIGPPEGDTFTDTSQAPPPGCT
jgi:hypothetical protein